MTHFESPSEPRKKRFGAAKAAALVGFLFGSDPALAGGKPTHEQIINFMGGQKVADQLVNGTESEVRLQKPASGSAFRALSKAEKQKEIERLLGGTEAAERLVNGNENETRLVARPD